MERTEICGLKGIGSGTKGYRLIPLKNKKKVTFGRSINSDVVIESPMISRIHAILKLVDGQWTVTDNKSLNGVIVNGKSLKPLEPCHLLDSARIQLGVQTNRDQPAEFVWIFKTKIKVKAIRQKIDNQETCKSSVTTTPNKKNLSGNNNCVTVKRKLTDQSDDDHDCHPQKRFTERYCVPETTQTTKVIGTNNIKPNEAKHETPLNEENKRSEEDLEKEKKRLLEEMEQMLKDKYQQKIDQEKEKFEQIIAQKEKCHKLLEDELNKTRAENKKQIEKVSQIKNDILSDFTQLIESELQCCICTELFVKATTLNCSHSYCSQCIEQWMSVRKICPSCRAQITSRTRSTVLDSYIDTVVEHLSDDMKTRRLEIIQERKALKLQMENIEPKAQSRSVHGNRHGRANRQNRNNRTQLTPNLAQSVEIPGTSRMSTRFGVIIREEGTRE